MLRVSMRISVADSVFVSSAHLYLCQCGLCVMGYLVFPSEMQLLAMQWEYLISLGRT